MILYEDPKVAKYNSRLKKMRIIRRLMQEELANISNVNIKSLSSYEQNPEKLTAASVSTVKRLANALNCEIDDIINLETIKDC